MSILISEPKLKLVRLFLSEPNGDHNFLAQTRAFDLYIVREHAAGTTAGKRGHRKLKKFIRPPNVFDQSASGVALSSHVFFVVEKSLGFFYSRNQKIFTWSIWGYSKTVLFTIAHLKWSGY